MSRKEALLEALEQRILILDGAMGTMIQSHRLGESDFRGERFKDHSSPLKGNNDLLSIIRPDIIASIHDEYFSSGSDIVETNTFNANAISQADYNLQHLSGELNEASARVARKAADRWTEREPHKPRFVAGALGPTNKTASLSPDVNDPGYRGVDFDELFEAYKEQALGLITGGVDILLVETIFDTLNAKAALAAIEEAQEESGSDLPVMVSGTITDASGRTLSGQTAEAFLISISHMNLLSVGFNCALGAKQLFPYLQVLSRKSDFRISAYPNAGLPNEMGEYDQTPTEMAAQIEEYLKEGLVNLLGGCCGTGPDHIRALAKIAANYAPRKIELEALSA